MSDTPISVPRTLAENERLRRRIELAQWRASDNHVEAWNTAVQSRATWEPWYPGAEAPSDRLELVRAYADNLERLRAGLPRNRKPEILVREIVRLRSDPSEHIRKHYHLFGKREVMPPLCGGCMRHDCVHCHPAPGYPELMRQDHLAGLYALPEALEPSFSPATTAPSNDHSSHTKAPEKVAPTKMGFALPLAPDPPDRTNSSEMGKRRRSRTRNDCFPQGWKARTPLERQLEHLMPAMVAKAKGKLWDAARGRAERYARYVDTHHDDLVALAWTAVYSEAAAKDLAILTEDHVLRAADSAMSSYMRRERLWWQRRDTARWRIRKAEELDLDLRDPDDTWLLERVEIVPPASQRPVSLSVAGADGGSALLDRFTSSAHDPSDDLARERWRLITDLDILTDKDWSLIDVVREAGTDWALGQRLGTSAEGARKRRARLASTLTKLWRDHDLECAG